MLRYESSVWAVLRGSLGRQKSSDSLPLSRKCFFLRGLVVFDGFSVSINALSPDESFSIRSREAFGPVAGDGGLHGESVFA